jgi:hypothetical protein
LSIKDKSVPVSPQVLSFAAKRGKKPGEKPGESIKRSIKRKHEKKPFWIYIFPIVYYNTAHRI